MSFDVRIRMADMSDIEDGFALKRRDKTRPGQKRARAPRGAHTIPPLPVKHILASFTLALHGRN
jgi:hypothetical protein